MYKEGVEPVRKLHYRFDVVISNLIKNPIAFTFSLQLFKMAGK